MPGSLHLNDHRAACHGHGNEVDYQLVLRAANWTVVDVDPPPGTLITADAPVIVKVTKP